MTNDQEARQDFEEIEQQAIVWPEFAEPTPQMIDAGVKAMAQASTRHPLPKPRDTIAAIWNAMFEARATQGHSAAVRPTQAQN